MCLKFLERVGNEFLIEEEFRVSLFRLIHYLGEYRVKIINNFSPNLLQRTFRYFLRRRSSRFERISLLLDRVNQWENLSQGRV